ncbi:hypothetical protein [Microbacterium sp. ISL-59]|uniref:hypothetical protein n=1 Tax=Microbacterium sp. ISL-59 TaxID=2819159 RepID=UPI002035200D|nr:hypothetical protein [Microbacterium sp. ISL-59]
MSIDVPPPWADTIGPCYTAATIARELGWTEEQVADETLSTLLALESREDIVSIRPSRSGRGGWWMASPTS